MAQSRLCLGAAVLGFAVILGGAGMAALGRPPGATSAAVVSLSSLARPRTTM